MKKKKFISQLLLIRPIFFVFIYLSWSSRLRHEKVNSFTIYDGITFILMFHIINFIVVVYED